MFPPTSKTGSSRIFGSHFLSRGANCKRRRVGLVKPRLIISSSLDVHVYSKATVVADQRVVVYICVGAASYFTVVVTRNINVAGTS